MAVSEDKLEAIREKSLRLAIEELSESALRYMAKGAILGLVALFLAFVTPMPWGLGWLAVLLVVLRALDRKRDHDFDVISDRHVELYEAELREYGMRVKP